MKFYTYILQSIRDGRYYIGSTNNVPKRLKSHNSGYSKSTKPYLPWKLVYEKGFEARTDAYKYEIKLKRMKSREALAKLIEEG